MTNTLTKTLKSLADNVIYAETTLSEYYKIGCIKVRFSDHMVNDMDCDLAIFCNTVHKQNVYIVIPMVGTYKEVQWFSNVAGVVDFITRFESMARIMLKSPVPADNQDERQASNVIAKQIEASEKVSYTEWCKQLSYMYDCKKFDFKTMLDTIYAIDPSIKMIKKLKKYGDLNAELKYNAIMAIYNSVKKCDLQ